MCGSLIIRCAIILSILLSWVSSRAWAETAQEILDQVKATNDAHQPKDMVERARMTIFGDSGRQRIRDLVVEVKNYGGRNSKSITFFLTPAELKNVGVLSWVYPDKEDEQWIYFPETERIRRLNASLSKDNFGDSDFSYEDSKLFSDLIQDWTKVGAGVLLSEGEPIDGQKCAVIEFTPKRDDLDYGKLKMWLNRADSTLRKMELYSRNDSGLTKVLHVTNFSTVVNIPTPYHLEMTSVRKNTHTVLEFLEIKYNQGLDDDTFSQRSLQRGPS